MGTQPADIANRAFDMIGRRDLIIGDIEEGSDGAQVALRVYDTSLRQLLRAAHWSFARKMAPLTLLADASGQTDGVGTVVVAPWVYEYAVPGDMMQARFVPQSPVTPASSSPPGNISIGTTPLTSVGQPPYPPGAKLLPAPFLMTTDANYPVDLSSNWEDIVGVSPAGRIVICTNVYQAQLVYTMYLPYPSMWPADFEQSLVNYITSQIAPSLARDPKFGLSVRDQAIKSTKDALMVARANSANESAFPQTTDHMPDWMRIRSSLGGAGPWGPGAWVPGGDSGCLYGSWSGLAFSDGSVY